MNWSEAWTDAESDKSNIDETDAVISKWGSA